MLFIDASKGFEKSKNQNVLRKEHIDKIMEVYSERKEEDKFSFVASKKALAENEFNLNIPRYVDTFEKEEPVDLEAVSNELQSIENDISETDETISGLWLSVLTDPSHLDQATAASIFFFSSLPVKIL